MKKNIRIFFLFTLMAIFTVNAAWAAAVALQDNGVGEYYVNMPANGTDELTLSAEVASFSVYDDGGLLNPYTNGGQGILVMTAPEGYVLQVSGCAEIEGPDDLSIYDGNIESGKILEKIGVAECIEKLVVSTGRKVSLDFNTLYSNPNEKRGLDLVVTLLASTVAHAVTIDEVEGGSVTHEGTTAKAGETVTLDVVPAEGFLFAGIKVMDEEGIEVVVAGAVSSFSTSVSFIMPGSDVHVTPTFSDAVTPFVSVPRWGEINFAVPEGLTTVKVYDDGGEDGYYSNFVDGNLVLTAPEGYVAHVTGNMDIEPNYDLLTIYDGTADAAMLMEGTSGYLDDIDLFSTSNVVTFHLGSDYSNAGPGLDFTVEFFKRSENFEIEILGSDGGAVFADKESAGFGETVTLALTPNPNNYIVGIDVTDADDNPVKVAFDGLLSTSATFVMPKSKVKISPRFASAFSVGQGAFVNMPTTGTLELTLANGRSSFFVYDDGGVDGDYSNNAEGTLVLTAPEGCLFRVTGNMDAWDDDYLIIYDGTVDENKKLMDKGENTGNIDYFSTGNVVTIYFHADDFFHSSGFELNVVAIDPVNSHGIEIKDVANGTVTSTVTSAKYGETVVLSVNPAEGFLLSGLEVMDADGLLVSVDVKSSYANSASFVMPSRAVSVTPAFTNVLTAENGFFFNMPADGTEELSLPAGTESIKIFDNGGENAPYTNGGQGTLVLTAPEDYVLQVSGCVVISGPDALSVYDGDTESGMLMEKMSGGECFGELPVTTGAKLTLDFNALESEPSESSDLDLVVALLPTSESHVVAIDEVEGGSVTWDGTTAKAGETVTLNVLPAEGFIFTGIDVYDEIGNIVRSADADNSFGKTISFTMPGSDVRVVPTFSNEEQHFVNMPRWGTKKYVIPDGLTTIKVYDNGGAGETYADFADGDLVLTAPEGYAIHVTGNMATEDGYDKLTVYGCNTDATVLMNAVSGSFDDIDIFCTGNEVAFHFYSDYSNYDDGFDLTVSLVRPTRYAAVSVVEGGENKKYGIIDGMYNGADTIVIPSQINVDTVVFNRDFSTDGYSTIMLPFGIERDNVEGIDRVLEFDGVSEEDGELQVNMVEYDGDLEPNHPYMLSLSEEKLVFHGGVTLVPMSDPAIRKGDWVFHGTFFKRVWNKDDPELSKVYGFSAEERTSFKIGDFVKFGARSWIRPLRAYMAKEPVANPAPRYAFDWTSGLDTDTSTDSLPERIKVVIVERGEDSEDGEEHTTVIGHINTRTGEFTMERNYDLKGRKLNGRPTARGAYYGKKVMVK